MNYKRIFVPGGNYFFTLVTEQRRAIFTNPKNIQLLHESIDHVRSTRFFTEIAYVILPDHLHCLWRMPNGAHDYATRLRLIKSYFTKHCDESLRVDKTQSREHKGEQMIWQRRYWEHLIRNDKDMHRHLDYIHYNPVKHSYVSAPKDWEHSSFSQFVSSGVYPLDWGSSNIEFSGIGGE